MRLKQILKEELDLETAMKEPAALWIQGLTDKEFKFFINTILQYNREYAFKVLKKKFDSMSENLFEELESLFRKTIKVIFPSKKGISRLESNFGKIAFNVNLIGKRDELVKQVFNRIRK